MTLWRRKIPLHSQRMTEVSPAHSTLPYDVVAISLKTNSENVYLQNLPNDADISAAMLHPPMSLVVSGCGVRVLGH